MSSGPSGTHRTPRRWVGIDHWPLIDQAALKLGDGTGPALVRRLLTETIDDTEKAVETCRRIRAASARDKRSET